MNLPKKLQDKLITRVKNKALRQLDSPNNLIDFSSNDYLGFAKSQSIFRSTHQFLIDRNIGENGATGSRLLSGNFFLYEEVEHQIASFHQSETALIFNSGYNANVGFFSSVPQRGDVVLYDELIHASIRDGIQLSNAKAYKFNHNNLEALEKKITSLKADLNQQDSIYLVTESVFSMDGNSPGLISISKMCKEHGVYLIVDEAHAIGVLGKKGVGEVQRLEIQNDVFARIVTFGKALGCHGAAILGGKELRAYLINYSRSFIYTTGLSPHTLATISMAYRQLSMISKTTISQQFKLQENITFFKESIHKLQLQNKFIESNSAIHCCIISGSSKVKEVAEKMKANRFDVKPILSPTVPKGKERLRFCLHSYNSIQEITQVLNLLSTFVTK